METSKLKNLIRECMAEVLSEQEQQNNSKGNEQSKAIENDLTALYKQYLAKLKELQGPNGIDKKITAVQASFGFDWNKQKDSPEIKKLQAERQKAMEEISQITQQIHSNYAKMKEMGLENRANLIRSKRKEQVMKIASNWTKNAVSDIQKAQKQQTSDLSKNLAAKREKYKQDLNAWYQGGQKGPQPHMPV
jgi:ATP-dependent Clp protease ATP-binding subunit ClpA